VPAISSWIALSSLARAAHRRLGEEQALEHPVQAGRRAVRAQAPAQQLLDLLELARQARHGRRRQALAIKQELGAGPAAAFVADAVGDRDRDVVEEHLVDVVPAVDGRDRADLDARRRQRHDEKRDACLLAPSVDVRPGCT
jgi:hypothetical protein